MDWVVGGGVMMLLFSGGYGAQLHTVSFWILERRRVEMFPIGGAMEQPKDRWRGVQESGHQLSFTGQAASWAVEERI